MRAPSNETTLIPSMDFSGATQMDERFVPKLGSIIDPKEKVFRDAVHIAVAPVIAGTRLSPGQHVGRGADTKMYPMEFSIGVVDPFLKSCVEEGETFWLFLYQNSVTNLRHSWSHPAFAISIPKEA